MDGGLLKGNDDVDDSEREEMQPCRFSSRGRGPISRAKQAAAYAAQALPTARGGAGNPWTELRALESTTRWRPMKYEIFEGKGEKPCVS